MKNIKSQHIRMRHAEVVAALEKANAQIRRAELALEDDALNAILTGQNRNLALRSEVVRHLLEASELEAEIGPLAAAVSILETQERDDEIREATELAARLRVEYNQSIAEMVAAVKIAHQAVRASYEVHAKFAVRDYGHFEVARIEARLDLGSEDAITAFTERICQAGLAEALPADDLGRVSFDRDQVWQTTSRREQAEKRSETWKQLDRIARGEEIQAADTLPRLPPVRRLAA